MKIAYKLQNLDTIYESMVFATFYRKNPSLIKRLFSSNKRLIMYYMVLIPNGDLFEADFIDGKQIIRIIDKNAPQEWIKINKYKSFVQYGGGARISMTLYNLSCYSWMIDEESFFVDVYEHNESVRELMYSNIPNLIKEIYKKSALND